MSLLYRRAARVSFAVTIAAYASAVLVAGLITVRAAYHLGAMVVGVLQPTAGNSRTDRGGASAAPKLAAGTPLVLHREANMTPLQDRWIGQSRPGGRFVTGPLFGGSSRGPSARPWGFGSDNDDDERPAIGGTYRTVCVRLCDGYYFPINFAVTPDRLQRDSNVCASRCGAQGRLFVHRNPGEGVEDMQDLGGRPYRQLRTAFLYRTEYVANCKCQPDPWETAAQDRHRAYALAQAARQGDKTAAQELRALQDKQRQTANAPSQPNEPAPAAGSALSPEKSAELARQEDGTIMRLGTSENPKARPEPKSAPRPDPDWVKRVFRSNTGY